MSQGPEGSRRLLGAGKRLGLYGEIREIHEEL